MYNETKIVVLKKKKCLFKELKQNKWKYNKDFRITKKLQFSFATSSLCYHLVELSPRILG